MPANFDIAQGRSARDDGMARAARAEGESFAEVALDAITKVARRQEYLFVDDVLAECSATPAHPNAWGAVWMRAIRAKIIVATDRSRHSKDPGKHAHRYPVYRSLYWDANAVAEAA